MRSCKSTRFILENVLALERELRGMYTTPAGNTHGAIFNEGETSFLLSMQGQYPASWRITVLMSPENIKSDRGE